MVAPTTPDRVAPKEDQSLRGHVLTATDVCWRHPFPHGSFTPDPQQVMNPAAAARALDPLLPDLNETEILAKTAVTLCRAELENFIRHLCPRA